MKKVIPVFLLIGTLFAFAMAFLSLLTAILATAGNSEFFGFLAAPFAVAGLTLSLLQSGVCFMFKKDRLCFVCFFGNLATVCIALTATILCFTSG